MPSSTLAVRIDTLLAQLGLERIADRRTAGFSLGERMKVARARAIVHSPAHVLLDEPAMDWIFQLCMAYVMCCVACAMRAHALSSQATFLNLSILRCKRRREALVARYLLYPLILTFGPASISYRVAPKEKTSVRASKSSPRTCSGDM